jgi:hypothetical protein
MGSINLRRPWQIGDRTVSRRSEPNSRTALIGEQPNPWDLLQPQDAMSRHRYDSIITYGMDYIFILLHKLSARRRWRFSIPYVEHSSRVMREQSLRGHNQLIEHAWDHVWLNNFHKRRDELF